MISGDSELPCPSVPALRAVFLLLIALGCVACLPAARETSALPKDAGGDTGSKDTGPLDLGPIDSGLTPDAGLAEDATPIDDAADATPTEDSGIAKDTPIATGGGGCASDVDCVGYLHNSCQAPSKCNAETGVCDPPENLAVGTKCPDNLCIVGGTCDAGVCKGPLVDCNDKNDCTADGCAPKKGCVHDTSLTIKCESKQICAPGKCAAGVCVPVPIDCGLGSDPCRKPKCNPTTGLCDQNLPLPDEPKIPCNDPLPCRGPGVCTKGSCAGINLCDTKNVCSLDVCLAGKCASYMTPDKDCSDGPCKPGKCTDTGSGSLSCVVTEKCNDKNPCTLDSCAASTGVCKNDAVAGTPPCDDGDICFSGDSCVKKKCQAGKIPVVCDDGNPCTDDAVCVPGQGCAPTNNSAKCTDGNGCTGDDACAGGKCAGKAISCDDGNACTTDACNPLTGCGHVALADGANCGTKKACSKGSCVAQ